MDRRKSNGKPKGANRWKAHIASAIGILLLVACPSLATEDSLDSLYREYRDASQALAAQGASAAELRAFRENALFTLIEAVEEHPAGPQVRFHLQRCTALANSCGMYDVSLDLLKRRAALAESPEDELIVLYQEGEVGSAAYLATKDESYARRSIAAFLEHERRVTNMGPDGEQFEVQLAVGLSRCGELAAIALHEPERAAELYLRSVRVLEGHTPAQREVLGDMWPGFVETGLSNAAIGLARSGQAARACEVLGRLDAFDEREQHMGIHLMGVIEVCEIPPPPEIVDFVESWYATATPWDPRIAKTAGRIARLLVYSQDPALQLHAADWLESVLRDHADLLLQEEMGIRAMREILLVLSRAYAKLDRDPSQFSELLPETAWEKDSEFERLRSAYEERWNRVFGTPDTPATSADLPETADSKRSRRHRVSSTPTDEEPAVQVETAEEGEVPDEVGGGKPAASEDVADADDAGIDVPAMEVSTPTVESAHEENAPSEHHGDAEAEPEGTEVLPANDAETTSEEPGTFTEAETETEVEPEPEMLEPVKPAQVGDTKNRPIAEGPAVKPIDAASGPREPRGVTAKPVETTADQTPKPIAQPEAAAPSSGTKDVGSPRFLWWSAAVVLGIVLLVWIKAARR